MPILSNKCNTTLQPGYNKSVEKEGLCLSYLLNCSLRICVRTSCYNQAPIETGEVAYQGAQFSLHIPPHWSDKRFTHGWSYSGRLLLQCRCPFFDLLHSDTTDCKPWWRIAHELWCRAWWQDQPNKMTWRVKWIRCSRKQRQNNIALCSRRSARWLLE